MASPRIFVSSTCYDLNNYRNNLRSFIERFGYEPVMSDFGDIFYDYNSHVQDACLREIEKCQMFILIIGNNYGSFYHKSDLSDLSRDSVTKMEFKQALETKIPKFIFIQKFVKYDYEHFRSFLIKQYTDYFTENDVSDDDVESVKKDIKDNYQSNYPFRQKSYKHIFSFLDIIYDLSINNAVYGYENSKDIEHQLKKQWAGFLYEKLIEDKKMKVKLENDKNIKHILNTLESIDKRLKYAYFETDKICSISPNDLTPATYSQLEHYQDLLDEIINKLIYTNKGNLDIFYFETPVSELEMDMWLDSLELKLKKYKWSKNIPCKDLYYEFNISFNYDVSVPYSYVLKLLNLYNSISEEDKSLFSNTLITKFNTLVDLSDDLPF